MTLHQATPYGYSPGRIRAQIASGRWQRVARSVYVTFSGPIPLPTRRWAALLVGGPDAVLSHATAADLWRLRPVRADDPIHVCVPVERTVARRPGIVIHRRRELAVVTHPALTPRRTRVEATVFDVAAHAALIDDAFAVIARACQLKLTTSAHLFAELERRGNQPWRRILREAVRESAAGVHSALELRYLRDVERAHGLPAGRRQRRVGRTYQDVSYDEHSTVVELDGRLGHSYTDDCWRDMRRDNAAAARAEMTLRYGWADVAARPCQVAAQVAEVLRNRGWQGKPTRCGRSCSL